MPTVPKYGQLKTNLAPLPTARRSNSASTPEAEGAGVGAAMAQFGTVAARTGLIGYSEIEAAARERADQIQNLKTLEAFNELDRRFLDDREQGFLGKRGIDAHEQSAKYASDYQVEADAIGANLTSERARLYYEQLRINRVGSFRSNVDRHARAEYDKYESDQFNATMESSINAAIRAGANDLATVGLQLREQAAIIATHGDRLGMSKEAQELLKHKSAAAVHGGVVEQLLAQQKAPLAQAYFQEVKDVIAQGDPDAVERIERQLSEGITLQEAQKQADYLLAQFRNEEDARAAAKQITDPNVRKETISLIEHEFAIKNKLARESYEKLTLDAINVAERTGSWRNIPGWTNLKVEDREAIKRYLEVKATGATVKTDPNVYASLLTWANSENPEHRKQFLELNVAALADRLSPADLQEMQKMQQAARKGQNDLLAITEGKTSAMVDEALGAMGLPANPAEKGKEGHDQATYDRVGAYRRAVREAVARLEAEKGKKATEPEVQSIVDQLRTRVGQRVVKGGFFSDTYGDAYAFEVGQARITSAADIPPGEKRKIDEALRATGKPVDDKHRVEYFNKNLAITRKDR
jgi:hypothetical protein